MAHQKHPPIKRPNIGYYARNEFALVGTTCRVIDDFLMRWHNDQNEELKTLIVTGDHERKNAPTTVMQKEKRMWSYHTRNAYDDKLYGSDYEVVLVNGNHYPAAHQVVFIDPKKAGTLERRREQLTDVVAIVLCEGAEAIPDWLREDLPELPVVFAYDQWRTPLLKLIEEATQAGQPTLKALILSGGKSTRMGVDKASLVYREGKSEADRLADICRNQGLDTYYSVSVSSGKDGEIVDRFVGLGPMGAIATAFLHDPDAAWLVLACDLPLVDETTIKGLIAERMPYCLATAVRGASKPFPEPLIAIYEPRAYGRLLQFLSIGYACPRKVLINSEVKEVVLHDEDPLTNANTPEERAAVLKLI